MSLQQSGDSLSFPSANASLRRGRVVRLNGSGQVLYPDTLADDKVPIGITLEDAAEQGDAVTVAINGVVMVECYENVVQGHMVYANHLQNGRINDLASWSGTSEHCIGFALESGSAGEFIPVLISRQVRVDS